MGRAAEKLHGICLFGYFTEVFCFRGKSGLECLECWCFEGVPVVWHKDCVGVSGIFFDFLFPVFQKCIPW